MPPFTILAFLAVILLAIVLAVRLTKVAAEIKALSLTGKSAPNSAVSRAIGASAAYLFAYPSGVKKAAVLSKLLILLGAP